MRKKTYEEVKNFFEHKGCKLLASNYCNSYDKLSFKCRCGSISEICFNQFSKSPQCRKCGIMQMQQSKSKGQLPCRVCNTALDEKNLYVTMDRTKYGNICRECYNRRHAIFQKIHGKSYYLKYNEKRLEYLSKRRDDFPELVRAQCTTSYHKTRIEVLKYYSPELSCVRCGFSDLAALSIDHINGNGNKHREEIHNANIYRWLKNNDYPEGFQILCMNCQFIKRHENKECFGAPKKLK